MALVFAIIFIYLLLLCLYIFFKSGVDKLDRIVDAISLIYAFFIIIIFISRKGKIDVTNSFRICI